MVKQSRTRKRGYIIILTLMIISAAVALITAIVQQSFSYQRQARIALDRVQARMLVLSSLELASSRLSLVIEKEQEVKGEKKPQEEVLEPLQKWLLEVLPQINRWQKFEFTEEDGLEGSVSIYMTSEQGKINLGALEAELTPEEAQEGKPTQPQPNKKGNQEAKSSFQRIDDLFKKEKGIGMQDALMAFRSTYGRPPEDVTELLRLKYFLPLKDSLFVGREESKKPLFMMDLFTLRPGKGKVNPWLLSRSLQTLLGLTMQKEVKITHELVKNMKPSMRWATDWDKVLAPLYSKKWAELDKEITGLFASEFEATGFSVVSYCTVGTVTQKIFAVLELAEPPDDISPKSLIYTIAKIYWL